MGVAAWVNRRMGRDGGFCVRIGGHGTTSALGGKDGRVVMGECVWTVRRKREGEEEGNMVNGRDSFIRYCATAK